MARRDAAGRSSAANREGHRGPAVEAEGEFSPSLYILAGMRHRPARYVLTVAALSLCVTFFVLVSSLGLGLQEELEGGLESDDPEPGDVTPDDPGGPPNEELEGLEDDVRSTILSWLYLMAVLLFITAGTTVATTMLITVRQRRREIGILKAVGLTHAQVRRLFLYETLGLCSVSYLIGLFAGTTLSNQIFNAQYEADAGGLFFAPSVTVPVIGLSAFVVTFATGIAGTLYPARRAFAMEPVEAMAP